MHSCFLIRSSDNTDIWNISSTACFLQDCLTTCWVWADLRAGWIWPSDVMWEHTWRKHVGKFMLIHFPAWETKQMRAVQLWFQRSSSCYMIRCGGWSSSASPSVYYRGNRIWFLSPFSVSPVTFMSRRWDWRTKQTVCEEQLSGPGSLSLRISLFSVTRWPCTHTGGFLLTQPPSLLCRYWKRNGTYMNNITNKINNQVIKGFQQKNVYKAK